MTTEDHTSDNHYFEYVFHSGDIVVCSLALEHGGRLALFNFIEGYGDHHDATIRSIDNDHPVREKVREQHEEALS